MDTPDSMQLPGIFAASVTKYLNIFTCPTLSAVLPNTGINVFLCFSFFPFFFLLFSPWVATEDNVMSLLFLPIAE